MRQFPLQKTAFFSVAKRFGATGGAYVTSRERSNERKIYSPRVLALLSVPALGACAETTTSEPAGPGFEITVAPLQLQGISDACYDILVENSLPDGPAGTANNVVSLTGICASQYGNSTGGDITYIATCDASVPSNWVTVWPSLYGAGGSVLNDWENPCGEAGCQLERPCNENEDTLVEFNFTIMRAANQGFFDVAVNFSDIFCSAKVDCQYDDGSWIRLVHNSDGVRTATAVVGFACTDGNDPGSPGATHLYGSQVRITCGNDPLTQTSYVVDNDTAGNVYGSNPDGPVAQAITFMGAEDLLVNGTNAGKVYWNTAIGFDDINNGAGTPSLGSAGANCKLEFVGTASEGPLSLDAGVSFLSYPFATAGVTLTDSAGDFVCGQHPLNGDASFTTEYESAVPPSVLGGNFLTGALADQGQAAPLGPN
jgi:hypothetical protein